MGAATARLLHSRGASLSLVDVQEEGLKRIAEELKSTLSDNQKIMHMVVDVSQTEQVNAWIEKTVSELGRLDGAANVAGVGRVVGPIKGTSDEEWEFVNNINAGGV